MKVYELYSSLTQNEQREFTILVNSNVLAAPGKVKRLLQILEQDESLNLESDKVSLFEKLFPDLPYDDKKVRYLYTDVAKTIEKYLTVKRQFRNPVIDQSMLGEELSERGCSKSYKMLVNSLEKNKKLKYSSEHYFQDYKFSYQHIGQNSLSRTDKTGPTVLNVVEELDKFYITQKLKLGCEMMNARNIVTAEHDSFLLDNVIDHLKKSAYGKEPIIKAYYQVYLTLNEANKEEHFYALKETLLANAKRFELEDLKALHQYATNYCIKKVNLGEQVFLGELFQLFKASLVDQSIFLEGKLSQWDYKNIITVGCRVDELDWAEQFLKDYRRYIAESERENAYNYNLAYVLLTKKDYSNARTLLRRISFTDLYYQLDSKAILLKIYYEQFDFDALEYHLDAFRQFLSRNKKISDYQREVYKGLITNTQKLLKAEGNKQSLLKLQAHVDQHKKIADLRWLKEKIKESIEVAV